MGNARLMLPNSIYPFKVVFEGVATAAGAATGTTLVSAMLAAYPSLAGRLVQIMSGQAIYCERAIATHPAGGNTITVTDPFTDNAGAVVQIPAGTWFCIKELGGGGAAPGPPPPSVGLWMLGVCDAGMAASTTVLTMSNLAGMPDDIFNDDFYAEIIRNSDNPGAAPEHEIQLVTNYVSATGAFTCNAFSANVEAGDFVAIIHHSLVGPQLNLISSLVRAIFDIVNASLVTTETGGTLTTTGALQDLYINNAPAGVFEPLKVQIDLTPMLAADTIVLQESYRIETGGGFILKDTLTFAGVQASPLKNIELEPNRYGIQITIQRTAGADHPYAWAVFYRG